MFYYYCYYPSLSYWMYSTYLHTHTLHLGGVYCIKETGGGNEEEHLSSFVCENAKFCLTALDTKLIERLIDKVCFLIWSFSFRVVLALLCY